MASQNNSTKGNEMKNARQLDKEQVNPPRPEILFENDLNKVETALNQRRSTALVLSFFNKDTALQHAADYEMLRLKQSVRFKIYMIPNETSQAIFERNILDILQKAEAKDPTCWKSYYGSLTNCKACPEGMLKKTGELIQFKDKSRIYELMKCDTCGAVHVEKYGSIELLEPPSEDKTA